MSESTSSRGPVMCTLSSRQRSQRVLEWSDVWRLARTTGRIEGGVVASFAVALAADIEDLAQRELDCWRSWLDISTHRSVDAIHLKVTTANVDGVDVIRQMAGLSDGEERPG